MLNEKAQFAVEILKQYAEEAVVLPRSTSDLSPLEEWLIIKLFINDQREKQLYPYLRQEHDSQLIRMKALNIPQDQSFEQMVNALLYLAEQK